MSALPEVFACPSMTSVKITRHGCGDRHARAKNNGRTPGARVGERAIFAAACRDCAIGAAHARGERPDVMIASLTARLTTKTKSEEGTMPRGKVTMIEHNGVTKALGQWAREAGLDTQTLRERLKRMPMSEALTRPLITPQESGAMSSGPGKKRKPRPEVAPLAVEPERALPSQMVERANALERAAQMVEQRYRALDAGDRASDDPVVELLTRLGFDVEDAGIVPAGRLILVRGAA